MAEQTRIEKQQAKKKIVIANICLETVKNTSQGAASTPSSPVEHLKTPTMKINCLCSPTTHAGSFRCRYHRLQPSGLSVGSKLSELEGKSAGIGDPWHAQ